MFKGERSRALVLDHKRKLCKKINSVVSTQKEFFYLYYLLLQKFYRLKFIKNAFNSRTDQLLRHDRVPEFLPYT